MTRPPTIPVGRPRQDLDRCQAMTRCWFLFDDGPRRAAANMAVDEALLERVSVLDAPVLRLYRWAEPAATFGYFQRYDEVAEMTDLRPLIRRPTGGGIVPHAGDWTYSLVFPPSHPWYRLRADESYRRLHEWLQAAFRRLGYHPRLAPSRLPEGAGLCFTGAERDDLLWQGRKLAGAAQRRNRLGLLIQASVQPPPPELDRTDWQKAFCVVSAFRDTASWQTLSPDPAFTQRANQLEQEKYSQEAYNRKR